MARQKFDQAEKSQIESIRNQQRQEETPTAPQGGTKPGIPTGHPQQGGTTTSRVSAQDAVLYREAIEKAGKVLKLHPDSKWVDDALWLIGKSYFALGEFTLADRKFKELVTNHPESKFADDSYYYMGLCQMNLGHNDQALSAFAFIEKAPKKSSFMENVIFSKAVMAMETENNSEAIDLFKEYLKKHPGGDSTARAMYNIGKCQEKLKDFAEAYRSYAAVKNFNPSRNLYFESSLASAASALKTDSIQTGMKILQRLAEDESFFSRSGLIKLKIAEGHYLQGDIDNAAKMYDEVITQNPQTPLSSEAYYHLGLIQQNDKFDLRAAKEAFGKAQSESPISEFRGLALARSAQIAKLESYQLQLQRADSLKRADELNSLGMDEPPLEPETTIAPDPFVTDSTGAVPAETLVVPDSVPVPDSADTFSVAPVTGPAVMQAAVSGPLPGMLARDSLHLAQAGGIDSGRFASILSADSVDKAIEDSIIKSQAKSSPVPKADSVAAKPAGAVPGKTITPSSPARDDSIRQAIILSGIETRYLLSELFAYELNRPDSAFREYLLIADEYPESHYAAKSLLAAARIEFDRGDTTSGRVLLERLIREHPDKPQAAEAAEWIDSPFDFSQNAMGLYASAESLAIQGEQPDSAITLFKYIADNFPDLAPKASYAAAWVLDEVKGVEDSSAFYAYTAVARDYPQTPYAEAANERLGKGVKQPRRQPSEREQETPDSIISPESKADTAFQNVQGLALAPPVKIPGEFVYPEALLSRDLRGKVVFRIRINISGKVEDYELIGPSGEQAIDSSASAALLRTEFDTSQLDLVQLDQYFQFSITFKRPDIDQYYDPYLEERERGGP